MNSEISTEVVKPSAPTGLLRPIVRPNELIEAQEELSQLIVKGLKEGVDYGPVPGTKGKKTLFKAGAERLQKAYGCHTIFDVVEKEIDHSKEVQWSKYGRDGTSTGLYRYVVRASVIAPNGLCVGSGIGSCSTLEAKYIDRPRDLENTILKMAQKRAKVAGTLDAFALSDRFTQDMEDIVVEKETKHIQGFDPSIKTHADKLIAQLKTRGIEEEYWDDIALKLKGRPSSDIDAAIKEVTA